MKSIITPISICFIAGSAFSQQVGTAVLDFNNTSAHLASNGIFFHQNSNQQSGYEVPNGSGFNALYMMGLAAAGTDVNGQLKGAFTGYEATDFFSGPVTQEQSQYNTPGYAERYAHLWPVMKSEIDNHIANWQTNGYVVPENILEWPGNGNILNGEPILLAPFFDRNFDLFYDPADGDYPIIRGDKAYFTIMNDAAGIHTASGSERVGMEVHLLFYQYDTDGALGNTTFIHAEAINRGTQSLSDFHFGSLVDFELGYGSDDFIGTAVDHNMSYVYNGDLIDGNGQGNGDFPPALGIITLNTPLYSHVPVTGFDFGANGFYNLLKGNSAAGDPQLDNNGEETRYVYNGYGTGWTEATMQNGPGDRLSYMSFQPATFSPGNVFCYDYAVVYSHSNAGNLFSSVDQLFVDAATVQEFYDDQNYADCANDDEPLGLNKQDGSERLVIWPNPANDHLTIDGIKNGTYEITAMNGKLITSGILTSSSIDISALPSGCYLLLVQNGDSKRMTRLIKK